MTDFNDKEQRYRNAMDETRQMKVQLDVLSGRVGELVTAIKGNDMGTEGVVGQIKAIKAEQEVIKKRLDEIEVSAAKKNAYIMIAVATGGALLGMIFRAIIDHLLPVKHL